MQNLRPVGMSWKGILNISGVISGDNCRYRLPRRFDIGIANAYHSHTDSPCVVDAPAISQQIRWPSFGDIQAVFEHQKTQREPPEGISARWVRPIEISMRLFHHCQETRHPDNNHVVREAWNRCVEFVYGVIEIFG